MLGLQSVSWFGAGQQAETGDGRLISGSPGRALTFPALLSHEPEAYRPVCVERRILNVVRFEAFICSGKNVRVLSGGWN